MLMQRHGDGEVESGPNQFCLVSPGHRFGPLRDPGEDIADRVAAAKRLIRDHGLPSFDRQAVLAELVSLRTHCSNAFALRDSDSQALLFYHDLQNQIWELLNAVQTMSTA